MHHQHHEAAGTSVQPTSKKKLAQAAKASQDQPSSRLFISMGNSELENS
jgi:hypothetical protein